MKKMLLRNQTGLYQGVASKRNRLEGRKENLNIQITRNKYY